MLLLTGTYNTDTIDLKAEKNLCHVCTDLEKTRVLIFWKINPTWAFSNFSENMDSKNMDDLINTNAKKSELKSIYTIIPGDY